MRSQFLLFPAALIASAPAQAYHYVSEAEGLAHLFPGATFTPREITLSREQVAALKPLISDSPFYVVTIRAWKVSTGGWVFLDVVLAHGSTVAYMVGVKPDGSIKGLEVIDCEAKYDAVQSPKWAQQFTGKRSGDTPALVQSVQILSGATLSCDAIAAGLRRVMTAYELFFSAQGEGG